MATEERYFADLSEDEQELARLKLLEDYLDDRTQAALISAGLGEDMRVLEVGPGAGSMVRWMADRVGPNGHVTALDINPRFVSEIKLPNVSILTGDVLDPPQDLGQFDLIYSRYVMMHLPDPIEAAKALRNLLKPGGSVVVVDPDFRLFRAIDPSHPHSADFDALAEAATEVLRDAGIMDINFGPKAAAAFQTAGFVDVDASATSQLVRGGSPEIEFWRHSLPPVQAAIEAYAPERAIDMGSILEAYDDPHFLISSPAETITFGRRPAEEQRRYP